MAQVVIGGNKLEPFVADELKFGAERNKFKNKMGGDMYSLDVLYKGAPLHLVVPHTFTRWGWSTLKEAGKEDRLTVDLCFKDVDPTLESLKYTGEDGVLKASVEFLGVLRAIETKFEAMVTDRAREFFPGLGFYAGKPVDIKPHEIAGKIRHLIKVSKDATGLVTGAYPPSVTASVSKYTQVFKGTAEVIGSDAMIPPESYVSGILKWGRCTYGLGDKDFGPHLEWMQLRAERKRTVAKCLLPPEPAGMEETEESADHTILRF